jgi:hypothetical protein
VDVHRFSYVARKGAWSMWDSLPEMALDIGFVVEVSHPFIYHCSISIACILFPVGIG